MTRAREVAGWSAAEVGDRLQIAERLELYCQAIDRREFERFEEVFAPEARLSYSMTEERGPELPLSDLSKVMREFVRRFCFTQHLLGLPTVELDGDQARSAVSLRATHAEVTPDGGKNTWIVYGTYRDRFVRTESGWRIAERVFTGGHTEGELLGTLPDAGARGQRAEGEGS